MSAWQRSRQSLGKQQCRGEWLRVERRPQWSAGLRREQRQEMGPWDRAMHSLQEGAFHLLIALASQRGRKWDDQLRVKKRSLGLRGQKVWNNFLKEWEVNWLERRRNWLGSVEGPGGVCACKFKGCLYSKVTASAPHPSPSLAIPYPDAGEEV